MDEIQVGQQWRHKKRGSVYEIVATDAALQIATKGEDYGWLEDEDFIAYRPMNGYRLFFRMREEFLDGRFERCPQENDNA